MFLKVTTNVDSVTQHLVYLSVCRVTSVHLREERCIFLRLDAKDFLQASRRVMVDEGEEEEDKPYGAMTAK